MDNGIGFNGNTLIIPRGKKGLTPISIDLTEINRIESRIPEIERSTMSTLPNLVTIFIVGMGQVANVIALLELELRSAKNSLEEFRAVALLDKAEDTLKSKNIKSSADTRDAAVVLDIDVKEAKEKVDFLTAISALIYSKHSRFEYAYNGAKKVFDAYIKTPNAPQHAGD